MNLPHHRRTEFTLIDYMCAVLIVGAVVLVLYVLPRYLGIK